MLHYPAVDTATLELLKELQQLEVLRDLRLVGGTALALQIGHRLSVDLDLFGAVVADEFALATALNRFADATLLNRTENIRVYKLSGTKVDIVNYPYPWLEDVLQEDGLRIAQIPDVAAMKLAAITGRGTRKDFIDLCFLLDRYSLSELLAYYRRKFHDGSEFLVLKSLTYFDDAEKDEIPRMIQPIDWNDVKSTIRLAVERYPRNT